MCNGDRRISLRTGGRCSWGADGRTCKQTLFSCGKEDSGLATPPTCSWWGFSYDKKPQRKYFYAELNVREDAEG